ncbi:MAG TPA: hemerythrin domain-containing protein [Pyrinomonadaceae bacterium]|jgi:iron-sulfur cluster repair protein YtfE (RIC family)|nr:hemerythrin domain-containing protein [Pyrinomonadaceae bacterium]
METNQSFNDLLQLHRDLDALFLEHQRALLRLDLISAATLLDEYERQLLAHIGDEESLMLPIYRERAAIPVGGAVDIFIGEHEKLRQYLALFKEEMQKLATTDDLEKGVLLMLDSQHLFKRLLVHHDNREKSMLYPLLDNVTSRKERDELFDRLLLSPVERV